jgi:hypothetical protein
MTNTPVIDAQADASGDASGMSCGDPGGPVPLDRPASLDRNDLLDLVLRAWL